MKQLVKLFVLASIFMLGLNLQAQEVIGYSSGIDAEIDFAYAYSNGGNSTRYSISKNLKEKSFEKEIVYEVDAETVSVRVGTNGSCTSGKITITIIRPDGKMESPVIIDDGGRISLSKSYTNKNKEMKLSGMWKFKIKAENATGKYSIDVTSK